MMVPETQPAIFRNNTVYSNNLVAVEVEYSGNPSSSTATIKYDDNIFVGFRNSNGQLPTPIYSNSNLKMFTNSGASFNNNVTVHPRSNWNCPATNLNETGGRCNDPRLKDETWPSYGLGDVERLTRLRSEIRQTVPDQPVKRSRVSPAVGATGLVVLVAGVWIGVRHLQSKTNAG
jgi:hypothetical protein